MNSQCKGCKAMCMRAKSRLVSCPLLALLVAAWAFGDLGVLPISKEEYAAAPRWKPEEMGVGEMPIVDLRGFVPKPGNQNPQQSCVGWAVAYAGKTYLEVRDQEWQPNAAEHVFSPAFIYNQINGGVDRGTQIVRALQLLKERGCATWAAMPYNPRSYTAPPSQAALAEAARFRCAAYYALDTGAQIRLALLQQNVVILGVATDPVFNSGKYQVFTPALRRQGLALRVAGTPHGHHAMCAVGFDDTRQAFLLMNSWGSEWGKEGFCWVSYDLMRTVGPDEANFVWEAWVIQDIQQKVTGPIPVQPPAVADKSVGIRGTGSYGGFTDRGHVWSWSAFVAGSPQALANIRQVAWRVPGAAQPSVSTSPLNAFQVYGQAVGTAGTMDIAAEVRFNDGSTQALAHQFRFAAPARRDFQFVQTDRYWGRVQGQPFWEWTLQLRGSLVDLADVRQVTYHLHPTFPDPHRVVTGTYDNGFAFTTRGWGRFRVGATVLFRDGTSLELGTDLEFRDPVRDVLTLTNIARPTVRDQQGAQQYDWTAYVDGPLALLRNIQGVRYFLHPTFNPNVRDVATGEEYGFPLSTNGWGEFNLNATVFFKDGTTQNLTHHLNLRNAPAGQPQGK